MNSTFHTATFSLRGPRWSIFHPVQSGTSHSGPEFSVDPFHCFVVHRRSR